MGECNIKSNSGSSVSPTIAIFRGASVTITMDSPCVWVWPSDWLVRYQEPRENHGKSWKIIKISSQHLALLFLSPFFPGAKSWRFTRPPRNKLNGLSAHCRRPELWHPQLKTNCFGIMSSPKSRQKHQTPMTSRRKLHQTDWRIAVVPWGPVDCRGHTWNATGQRRWRGWRVAPANLPPETSQGMQGALYWIYQQSIWF